jgi:cell wall-associated NlpC family hydrolase
MMPEIGDFVLVDIDNAVGKLIKLGQWLNGDGFSLYEHAAIFTGGNKIVEATPYGARLADLSEYENNRLLWSTGAIVPSPVQRVALYRAALGYVGTRYSFADYAALAAHRLHLWAPGLKSYVASSGHMICSQLVDQCYQDAGIRLFADNRWPGYVTPADLYNLIKDARK